MHVRRSVTENIGISWTNRSLRKRSDHYGTLLRTTTQQCPQVPFYCCPRQRAASGVGRTNAATAETVTTDARKKTQAAYDRVEAELSKLVAARPVAEIEA